MDGNLKRNKCAEADIDASADGSHRSTDRNVQLYRKTDQQIKKWGTFKREGTPILSKKSSERRAFSYSSGRKEKDVRQMLEWDIIEIIETERLVPA